MPKNTSVNARDLALLENLWREPIERYALPNGLTVLLKHDDAAPRIPLGIANRKIRQEQDAARNAFELRGVGRAKQKRTPLAGAHQLSGVRVEQVLVDDAELLAAQLATFDDFGPLGKAS
jgi:hypothetical protein